MLPIYLEQRFQMLLNLAKEGDDLHIARENLAAAKEIIHTLYAVDCLTLSEALPYHQLCTNVQVIAAVKELPKTYTSFDDGVRAVQVAP